MNRKLLVACALLLAASWSFAGTEGDRLAKQLAAMPKDNNERGATVALEMLNELCVRAGTAKHFADRRQYQMMINDVEELIGKLSTPEAMKVFANALPRLQLNTQISVCFGLKLAPAHAEVDAAVLKLLTPAADNKLKVAAMDLLARHKVLAAVDKIYPFLAAEQHPSVQIAACRALAWLPDKHTVPTLLKYMETLKQRGNGRFLYEATAALRSITGANLSPEMPAWVKWWAENEKSFAVNPDAPVDPKFNFELGQAYETTYYDIPVVETRLVFILDMSGSMAYGGRPSRLEQAKIELKKIIAHLRPEQQFNVIAFASGSRRWQTKQPLAPGTDANKADAAKFVDTLKALGGTQTTEVMEDVIRDIASVNGCESVYLVTDGNPNPWANGITNPMQSRHLTWFNQPYKVRINTIGIYTATDQEKRTIARDEDPETMKQFLYSLATNNDGVYREIGK